MNYLDILLTTVLLGAGAVARREELARPPAELLENLDLLEDMSLLEDDAEEDAR